MYVLFNIRFVSSQYMCSYIKFRLKLHHLVDTCIMPSYICFAIYNINYQK